jgi:flagellar protein FlgJ
MEVHAVQRRPKASQLPLEKLATSPNLSQSEKLGEVSRQFEAILLRQILGEAQKPVFQSKFNTSSVAGDVYRDLITQQMADEISRSGSLGFARGLDQQLQHQLKPAPTPPIFKLPANAEPHPGKGT